VVVGVKIAKMVAVISVGTAKAVGRRCADAPMMTQLRQLLDTATFGYGNFWIRQLLDNVEPDL
jgi:hypothetical protein